MSSVGSLGSIWVLGGGPAGLIAAAALAPHSSQVVVMERDPVIDGSGERRGAPQAGQLHNLLEGGLQAVDFVLPGLVQRLVQRGSTLSRVSSDVHIHEFGQRLPQSDLGLRILSVRRPLLEQELVTRVERLPNVKLAWGVDAAKAMSGLEGHPSLLVDATGVSSVCAQGLADLAVDRLPLRRWYSSAEYSGFTSDTFAMHFPAAPGEGGALLSPLDPGLCHISVSGELPAAAVRTDVELRRHLACLGDRYFETLLEHTSQATNFKVFRRFEARRYRYDLMDAEHLGLLCAVGDAALSLSPLAGLGLTVAAQHGALLARLASAVSGGSLARARFPMVFAQEAGALAQNAWVVAQLDRQPLAQVLEDLHDFPAPVAMLVSRHLSEHNFAAQSLNSRVWHLTRPLSEPVPDPLLRSARAWHEQLNHHGAL